jgi:hydroxymethylbilane synthase
LKERIVIGTRGSQLALWQAYFIKTLIEKKNKNCHVEINIIKTKGDKILDVALSKIGDKGLFTKELENELLNGNIDIAVHSLKDLQTSLPKELIIGAITKRHKVEDVLIARRKGTKISTLKENAVVATGSLRRQSQLLHLRPDIKTVELRGNVPSRINKFKESNWDAIILARAGVERLKLEKHISSVISKKDILPAVGQGALAIEVRKNNKFAIEILKKINDEKTEIAVTAERAFLKTLEGGCQVPIGAFANVTPKGLFLEGFVGNVDGSVTFRKKLKGSKKNPEQLGIKLAADMIKAGAGQILKTIYSGAGRK